ncbi:MAG: TonB-dependent receptor [Bacteroidales bacterium]|nr:TonB-dependent receptor [Candidatus Colimorpha onthohippi]
MLSAAFCQDTTSLPIIEIKADRTIIYPQRMNLHGNESLLDILQMYPDLMIAGYEDLITGYNLRIDNCPMNADTRMLISGMLAKDILMIQVCDNTGVAKGTIGEGRVLDINMVPYVKGVEGYAEGDIEAFTSDRGIYGVGDVNMQYGNGNTDLYANASYRYEDVRRDHVMLHMTNRFGDRDRLITHFTQQYANSPSALIPSDNSDITEKYMGRFRYFHTFNDIGTELLLVGGYQYAQNETSQSSMPMYIVELNTPLVDKNLSFMLGTEGDFLTTNTLGSDMQYHVFNNDIYTQLTYALTRWRLSAGNRVMFYDYGIATSSHPKSPYYDTRDNANISAIFLPSASQQVQVAYYKKYYNPAYVMLFDGRHILSDDEWAITKGQLDEQNLNELKVAYAYSKNSLTLKAEGSYYAVEAGNNFGKIGVSGCWRLPMAVLNGGANLYTATNGSYATLRFATTLYLPKQWQVGLQGVYYSAYAPQRASTGVPVYGCVTVDKTFGKRLTMSVAWHDMFSQRGDGLSNQRFTVILRYRF